MKLVDAHVHLSDVEYAKCTDELVADAKDSNVVALVSNSMDYETSIGSLKLARATYLTHIIHNTRAPCKN